MTDIIMSMPWQCGEKDCKVQWHQANYWIDGCAYTVDWYGDGDHETIEENELPTDTQCSEAWREYARHVVETGVDPLSNFIVKHSRKVKERWEFQFNFSILGYLVTQGRHAGKIYRPHDLPPHVRSYLNLAEKGAPVLQDFATPEGREEFIKLFPKFRKWNVQHIEHDKPREPSIVSRELQRAARRAA